jgi:hypothetical protein
MKYILITEKITTTLMCININNIVYIYKHKGNSEISLVNGEKLEVVETMEELLNQITIINKLT